MTYEDRPSRQELEREEAEDLIAWAGEHAPELLPEYGDDEEDWRGVLDSIRSAKWADDHRRYKEAHPEPVKPDPRFADMEEPF